jgi:hypothetical protein
MYRACAMAHQQARASCPPFMQVSNFCFEFLLLLITVLQALRAW